MAELVTQSRRRVRRVWLAEGLDPSPALDELERAARRRHLPLEVVPRGRLERAARTESHQGVVAWAEPIVPAGLEELARPTGGAPPFLLVAAGVTDPHNLGALLRSFEAAGATGVVLPRHRSVHLTPTVTKVAAGAVEHLRFAVVPGVPSALEQLERLGVWRVGLSADAPASLFDLEVTTDAVALVVGHEGRGLSNLVRRRLDHLVAIPLAGAVPSLNVAAAGAVAAFEVGRRRGPGRPGSARR